MFTDLALCSAALVKLGAHPIASFDEMSAEAEVAARLYPICRDSLLSAYPWSFSIEQKALEADPLGPAADFAYAFILPDDTLRTVSAGSSRSGRGVVYRIFGDRLHADHSEIVLTYQRRVGEASFPPFFTGALIARLAAEFCLPLTENSARADVLIKLAANEFRLAKQLDGQQSTPRAVEDFTLIDVRAS